MSTVSLFVGLFVLGTATINSANQIPLQPGEGSYSKGEWTYQLVILARGTTDERRVGKITFKGKEVVGIPDARLSTSLGEFQWAGYTCDTERVGWYRIDPTKKYARWIQVRIDTSRDGLLWTTIAE